MKDIIVELPSSICGFFLGLILTGFHYTGNYNLFYLIALIPVVYIGMVALVYRTTRKELASDNLLDQNQEVLQEIPIPKQLPEGMQMF